MVAPLVAPIREPQLGGTQAVITDVASGLAHRGHKVDVYAAKGSVVPGAEAVETGVDSEDLARSLYRWQKATSPNAEVLAAFAQVYERIAAGSYDVVHNHAFDAPSFEFAAELDVPVVHTLHLPPDPDVAAAVRRAKLRRPATVVAGVSNSHAQGWGGWLQIDVVLRNGVPLDRIPWSARAGHGLLWAGRLSAEKGAVEAVEIAERAGMKIELIGDAYDADYAYSVRERVASVEGAKLVPPLARQALWRAMVRAAAVICPLRWEEPFGMVAAEAQAAGTPVIAFNRGAIAEVIADGVTGALVREGDLDAAAAAARGASAYDRRACRLHAEETLDLNDTLRAHEALYFNILSGSAVS
jgi:UDP-glucose:tetrahydrobiopterin glucosyltransferase